MSLTGRRKAVDVLGDVVHRHLEMIGRQHRHRPLHLIDIGHHREHMKRSETITNKWIASKAGWTPYDGVRVTGWPVGTFVRGRRVMWQGEVVTPSQGEPERFLETLKA